MRSVWGIVIALVVIGCSLQGQVDGPVLTAPFDRTGRDALIMGTLAFDSERNCLTLVRDGVALAVVWPLGTSWQADPPGVLLANGQLIEVGMSVTGGGGSLPRSLIERKAGSEVADAGAACAGPSGEIILFDSEGEIATSDD